MHDQAMQELIAKANQAILQAQYLRREGRALRIEAAARASELGQTVLRAERLAKESGDLKASLDQVFSKP